MEQLMIEPVERPTSMPVVKVALSLIATLCMGIGAFGLISAFLVVRPLAPSLATTTGPTSRPTDNSLAVMTTFMRAAYDATMSPRRKRRQLTSAHGVLALSDELHSIVSVPNSGNHSTYRFVSSLSLANLTHVDLVLPVRNVAPSSTIRICFDHIDLLFNQPFQLHKNWLKINVTQYISHFPTTFHVDLGEISLSSSAFLTLHFRRAQPSSSRRRRDLRPSLVDDDDGHYITNPTDPSACQVRPWRTSFAELNWTSWIVEPSSYEMNICSGTCQTGSNVPSYFTMQHLLGQRHPGRMPTLCCKPTRFAPTVLLYYDGSNLVLKRHENMRVVECGCS